MKQLLALLIIILTISCQTEDRIVDQPKHQYPELADNRYNVAFLIMDGTFNTEFTAPFDIFQHTIFRDSIKAMNVFTVAQSLDPVTTFEGVRILPDFS